MTSMLHLLLAALVFPAAATAEETPFRAFDSDRDGRLSPREVAALSLNFSALDTDADGYLSRSEIRHAKGQLESTVKNRARHETESRRTVVRDTEIPEH